MSKPPELTLYAYDTRPDIKILKQILEDKDSHIFYTERNLKTIRLKYQAMTEVPSIIEKTMSEVQLFESGSPFWATDLTVKQINDVLKAHEELSQQDYSEFMEYLLTTVREPNYDINYIGTDESALTCYYKLFNFL